MMNLKGKAMRLARSMSGKQGSKRPHELLLFIRLESNEGTYTFDISHDEAVKKLAIAKGLRERDAFLATGMAIGVLPVKIAGGEERPSAAAPVYFGDANVFTEAAGTANLSEQEAIESVWVGGEVTLKTNSGVRIDKMSTLDFRTALTTQGSASTQNEQTGQEVKSLGAGIRFGGGDENEITVKVFCTDKTHIGGNADRANYLMVRLVGTILKGATTAKYTS